MGTIQPLTTLEFDHGAVAKGADLVAGLDMRRPLRITEEKKFAALERALGVPSDRDLARVIEPLNADLGLPSNLRTMGVTEAMVPRTVEGALQGHCTATNTRPLARERGLRDVVRAGSGAIVITTTTRRNITCAKPLQP